MDKNQSKKSESGLFGKGQRYWSVMLVGEHGRIVPFHRFKEIAIGVIGLSLLSLAALIVLSWLYIQQGSAVHRLENELNEFKQESSRLKNERDVLKAKLVRQEIHTKGAVTSPKETSSSSLNEKITEPTPLQKDRSAEVAEKARVDASHSKLDDEKQAPKSVKWSGNIGNFTVDYDARKQILKSQFRINNTSTPKNRLSGRIVIVFKNTNEPPIKWLVVPHVPLKDGKPLGNEGKLFTIRNYRTMDFAAYGIPAPIEYNIVSVYVFLDDGKMLLSKDYGIKIEPEPIPTPTPKPTPTPTPIATPTPTPVTTATPVESSPSENDLNKAPVAPLDYDIVPQSTTINNAVGVSPEATDDVSAPVPATNVDPSKNPVSEPQIDHTTDPSDTETNDSTDPNEAGRR